MPELRYSAEAKEDLKQIARYIARDKPIAARQWATKLRETSRMDWAVSWRTPAPAGRIADLLC